MPVRRNRSETLARAARALRARAPLIAGFVGVGAVGVLVGRLSSSPAQPGTSAAPSASTPPSPEPQVFDITEDPRARAGILLRPMDRDIFAEITAARVELTRMKDVFPDRPYRVAFVGSMAERRVGLVMVDLDRDGKWDERWEIRKGAVERLVHQDPAAGGTPVKYTLGHGRWQAH